MVAAWLGLVTGLVEGAGLLLFQRINWARWGAVSHVSAEILWISAVVDVAFFSLIALIIALAGRYVRPLPVLRAIVFVLTVLAAHDWLALTERLSRISCWLLAVGVAAAIGRWFAVHSDTALRFWRKTLPAAVAAIFVLAVAIHAAKWLRESNVVRNLPAASPDAPNVLVIVVDTLRADHLSSYGYTRPTSPNIDQLAAQGVLFENVLSTTSWSLPSHASLLTGRYQFEHGVDNIAPLPVLGAAADSAIKSLGGGTTLGEVLQQRGYRTGAFSANRTYFTGNLGFSRSFVHFEDYFHSPADMFLRTFLGRQIERNYLQRTEKSKPKRLLRWLGFNALLDDDGDHSVKKRAPVVNEELLQWIDGDRQRPFFAFLNYFDVHAPYGAPRSYAAPAWSQNSPTDRYDDGIRYTDDAIGTLLTALNQRNLGPSTIVIFTSDHGESLGQHHVATHADALYRELIQVPLIIRYPGHVPAGVRVPQPVTNAAIPATVMDLLGGANAAPFPPGAFPRRSVTPLWRTSTSVGADVLSELAQDRYGVEVDRRIAKLIPSAIDGSMKSLVTPQWHLIEHQKFGYQLYDWNQDPGETHNLIDNPSGQEAARNLKKELLDLSSGEGNRATASAPSSAAEARAAKP